MTRNAHPDSWRSHAVAATACVALIGLVWLAVVLRIGFEREDDILAASDDLAKLAIAYEEHTLRTLQEVDHVLSLIKDEYERQGPEVDIARIVRSGRFDSTLFSNVGIVDRNGILVSGLVPGGRVDLSDREYFTVHRGVDSGTIFIGPPMLGRVTGKWGDMISRRLNAPEGSFAGVVFMAVDPAYLARFYRRIDLGPEGVVSFVGLDGIARVRQLGDRTSFGEDLSGATWFEEIAKARVGTYITAGKLDGIARLYSYRVLDGYPAVVGLGQAMTVVTQRSDERRRYYYLGAALVTAAIGAAGGIVIVLLRRRNRALAALRDSEGRFRALAEQNIAGIYVIQDGVIKYVNPRCAEIGGYTPEELTGRSILDFVPPQWHARIKRQIEERTSGAVKTAEYVITGQRKDGSSIEVGIHATRAIVDGRPAIIGLMQDIGERRVAEQAAKRHLTRLEAALEGTIEALSTMLELRDPYTAGHQRQVGDLAAAIGVELGLEEDRVKGLRFGGYVHDIGKIAIPAEILSKPGKLTANEFELIKTHPQQGYDVLKAIEFPWPVARAILEHHERLDGSGYPRGLRAEEISLEARILAVADVVEAMSSHRPYRAALGMDAALREIQEQSGKRYDSSVVAACLRVVRSGAFKLAA
ncbi:MAG TPA: HD domain-containing phosphohydrolase [Casimicrobiaceae bacterium]|nr:HD domain-containing phosphohydrolase [Casimicrobiaceae bacterium]